MRLLKLLDEHFEEYLLAVALGGMCILIGLQILFRYFVNMPLAWTEELARYLFAWLIYVASSLAIKKRRHLKVDAVLLLFGNKGRFVLRIISNILFLVFCIFIAVNGSELVYVLQVVRVQKSPVMFIPMSLIYASVPIGALLMGMRIIQDTILLFKERRNESEELKTKDLLQKQIIEELNLKG